MPEAHCEQQGASKTHREGHRRRPRSGALHEGYKETIHFNSDADTAQSSRTGTNGAQICASRAEPVSISVTLLRPLKNLMRAQHRARGLGDLKRPLYPL